MSSNWIILIPEDPTFVPLPDRQAKAVERFREIAPGSMEIKAISSEQLRFVFSGANFSRVICPACGADVDTEWWWKKMDQDYDPVTGFTLSLHVFPCCAREGTLQDLIYDWPQGFAMFSLEAYNPEIGMLIETYMHEFENILGCPLRVIYRHV